ncbi:hypothetical protein ACFX2I_025348 [Malus domestica]
MWLELASLLDAAETATPAKRTTSSTATRKFGLTMILTTTAKPPKAALLVPSSLIKKKFVVKIAKAMGHHVTVISSSDRKREEALDHIGADEFLVSSDSTKMLEAPDSFDYIIDTVPMAHPLEPYLSLLKLDGKLILMGVINTPLQFVSPMVMLERKTITGRSYQPEDAVYDFEDKINFAVFPSLQGGPHNHQIGALAVSPKQAMTPGLKAYAKQVKANVVSLGNYLMSKDYKLVTGGTENHLVLWDLKPLGLTGNKVEKLCDLCNITVNKNAVFGVSSALAPGGVRIGAPSCLNKSSRTTRSTSRIAGPWCSTPSSCFSRQDLLHDQLHCFLQ